MFGFAALMGVILSIIAFVEDKTFSVLFSVLSLVSVVISYGLWRASRLLSERKKALKNQLD
jgi:hypothetical protein